MQQHKVYKKAPGTTGSMAALERQKLQALATRNDVNDVEAMTMTLDEWLLTGLNNAEQAESDANEDLARVEGLLDRAIYCFEQAKDDVLARKARAHRASIRLRFELETRRQESNEDDNDGTIEVELAQVVQLLLSERLLMECRTICESTLSCLAPYSRKRLEQELLSDLLPN